MSKKIEYELNCRIKGKKLIKKIEIDFIPNQRHEDFAKIQSEIIDVQRKWNHIKALQEEVSLLLNDKENNTIENIKIFKDKIEKVSEEIKQISGTRILERRFKLVKNILIDNGYGDEADLMSWDFWNNSVEPATINEFLEIAVYKDIDTKKKVVH